MDTLCWFEAVLRCCHTRDVVLGEVFTDEITLEVAGHAAGRAAREHDLLIL